jgi:flagellar basal-body rod protein FlgB
MGRPMALSDIPLLSMLRTKMEWHQTRQRILAENVANADTPGFRPHDLSAPKFEREMEAPSGVTLVRTESNHIEGTNSAGSPFRNRNAGPYEIRPTGNAVSLEEEMMKVAANQMDFQAATTLYTHSLNLIKTALGKR